MLSAAVARPGVALTPGEAVAQHTITAYTLTPEQLHKAEGLHRTSVVLSLSGAVLGFAVLAVLIASRFGPRLQRFVQSASSRRFVQAILYFPMLLLTLAACELPLEIYGHHISLVYGLSVQGWASWASDWSKQQLIVLLIGTPLLAGLYSGIRRSPRRWWLYCWLVSLPIMAALVFAAPVLIDPIFNRFEPLSRTTPQLTAELRSLAHSTGLDIPASRIFLMHASDKVTGYNAYVTSFSATKRIVVWDTTARDLTPAQTLFIFGHEMGHYVLHHIYLGMACSALLMFFGFYLLQRLAHWMISRYGRCWQVNSAAEWSSLPVLILLASLLSFFGNPIGNTFSRWEEHQADVFALQITAPVTANSGQVAAQTFQLLGENGLSYPYPSRLLVFWSYSHPPIAERIRFALAHPDGH